MRSSRPRAGLVLLLAVVAASCRPLPPRTPSACRQASPDRARLEACLKNRDASAYVADLQDVVIGGWQVPRDVPWELCAVVEFSLAEDGSLGSGPDFTTPSLPRFNASVLDAFARGVPIRPIPPGAECLIGLPLRAAFWNPQYP